MTHVYLAQLAAFMPVLSSLNWAAVGERALYAGGGFLVALVGAYLVLMRDVSYIKGKIEQLTDDHEKVEQLRIEVSALRSGIARWKDGMVVSRH